MLLYHRTKEIENALREDAHYIAFGELVWEPSNINVCTVFVLIVPRSLARFDGELNFAIVDALNLLDDTEKKVSK
jgi:hypothetical protein